MIKKTVCYYMDVSLLEDGELYKEAVSRIIWRKRLEAMERYRLEKDKRLCLGAGLLIRYALEKAGACDMELKYDSHGKPSLVNNPRGVFFNCSHSGSIVACAVSDSEVGVDAEMVAPVDKRVIKRVFTEEEQKIIGDDTDTFFRFWTRKESCLKLSGDGMSRSLKTISVLGDNRWQFTEYSLEGYKLCVCGKACEYLVPTDVREVIKSLSKMEDKNEL